MVALQHLNLSQSNMLSDEGLHALSSIPLLQHVDVTKCIRITANGLQKLLKDRPNLQVTHEPHVVFSLSLLLEYFAHIFPNIFGKRLPTLYPERCTLFQYILFLY